MTFSWGVGFLLIVFASVLTWDDQQVNVLLAITFTIVASLFSWLNLRPSERKKLLSKVVRLSLVKNG